MLRKFPTALKLYDRALDITPNDPDIMAAKAGIYQAEGNLQEAARLIPEMNWQTSPWNAFWTKIVQLRLERNPSEAVRLAQARLSQPRYASEYDKGWGQLNLALMQRLAGDTAGARVTAARARDAFEQSYRGQPDNGLLAASLAGVYAVMGEKDLALKLAERAVMLLPRAKDAVSGPAMEENLALIQTMFAENSRAISILTQLLQTPYDSWVCTSNVTPALLRLDPLWDSLRSDPGFQKLCEEKQK